ncbi:MAG: GntR family transcriptional regulator [Pigmentiphaga sp.]|uniref:GntR family transcriptional regulator n=1 Tax=Pigmentiphaga sp. TaxID=1977564 RepID=UPI0029A3DF79|nr:GntR family transcriptional regulator [Pigmentiphaga sp.]MDX3907420.1 GntR family transcriptional regulator [Pigmentiphaga sp.]
MLKIDTTRLAARKSLSREIYESLETAIVEARILPGTRLAEDVLSETFGVSRSPVREAISELQRVGFAERAAARDRRVTVPTEQFIIDCFDVWILLESERLYESSLRSSPAAIKKIRQLLEQLGQSSEPDSPLLHEFHAALRADCRNQQLQRVGDDWSKYVRWLRNLYFTYDPSLGNAQEEHRRLVELYEARQRDQLTEALRRHVSWQRDRIVEQWRRSQAGPEPGRRLA